MGKRVEIPTEVIAEVLIECRRRCCLCVYLDNDRTQRKGQIAHVNQRRDDKRKVNLAYLCLDHHDDYDGRTSQSKGFTEKELRFYRDKLVAELAATEAPPANEAARMADALIAEEKHEEGAPRGWHFPFWLLADCPELFAFRSPGADGICMIERVDLPDGRIAIACVEIPGNPGRSVTNAAEDIYDQVCQSFDLPKDRLLWLEHHVHAEDEWRSVDFARSDDGAACDPQWTIMTPAMWDRAGMRPRDASPPIDGRYLPSLLVKMFPWPPDSPALGFNSPGD